MSATEIKPLRLRALELAVSAAVGKAHSEILAIAKSFHDWIEDTSPRAEKEEAPKALPKRTAPAKATATAPSAENTAGPAANAQPTALTSQGAPATIPAPVTILEVAESLKALVQDASRGGRQAAVDLLGKFGGTQLNQIPPAKLAELKAALDATGKAASSDPTGGLL